MLNNTPYISLVYQVSIIALLYTASMSKLFLKCQIIFQPNQSQTHYRSQSSNNIPVDRGSAQELTLVTENKSADQHSIPSLCHRRLTCGGSVYKALARC